MSRLLVVFLLSGVAAFCSSIPASSGTVIVGIPPTGTSTSGTGFPPVIGDFADGLITAFGEANGIGVVASASATADAMADTSFTYYMVISGTPSPSVPLTLSGIVGASIGPEIGAEAYSSVEIIDETQDAVIIELLDCAGSNCGGTGGAVVGVAGSFSQAIALQGGDLIEIQMAAVANPNSLDLLGTSANAIADPFFQIDPAFLASNPGVSLQFSDGIVNAPDSSVPEPSGLLLVGGGLAGIIFLKKLPSYFPPNRFRASKT